MKKLQAYDDLKTPKKPRSKSRERFETLKDEGLRGYVRGLPCIACESKDAHPVTPIQCAHVTSKGAAGGDWDNMVPLCGYHHGVQHRIGIRSFEFKYGIRLKAAARKVTSAYLKWKAAGGSSGRVG